jgi:molybdopterin-binding protein
MGRQETDDTDKKTPTAFPGRPPKPGLALSGTVLAIGLVVLGVGAYSFVTDSASLENRVEVTATVTDTGVDQVEGSRGRDAYVATVTFQYQYEGSSYSSDKIYPGESQPRYSDRATAEGNLPAVTAGDTVTAFVNPDAPSEAYLKETRSGQATVALVTGFCIALLGGGRLWQLRSRDRKRW